MQAWEIALITSAAGLGSGLVSAGANTWLAGRAKVSEELRQQRLEAYPAVWKRTSRFSRWPREQVSQAGLREFHEALRAWYYDTGGLYMSENARARYGALQELAAAHLARPGAPGAALADEVYDDLMDACSAFRTALTEDLESRRQASLPYALRKARAHRRQERAARARLRRARREEPAPGAESVLQ